MQHAEQDSHIKPRTRYEYIFVRKYSLSFNINKQIHNVEKNTDDHGEPWVFF